MIASIIVTLAIAATCFIGSPCVADSGKIALDVPEPLIVQMASVAKGESGVDLTDPACVMRNRILNGWSQYKVLNHFYAAAHRVSQEEIDAVRATINLGVGCDDRAYFQWSLSDVRKVHPDERDFLYEANGNRYYSRGALKFND